MNFFYSATSEGVEAKRRLIDREITPRNNTKKRLAHDSSTKSDPQRRNNSVNIDHEFGAQLQDFGVANMEKDVRRTGVLRQDRLQPSHVFGVKGNCGEVESQFGFAV